MTSQTSSISTSHNKINRISDLTSEMSMDMQILNNELQNLRLNLEQQKRNMDDRVEKSSIGLGSKVQRLASMLEYAIS